MVSDPNKKRGEILQYFQQTFDLYERLFDCLQSDNTYYVRANTLRHPLIFYFGHTATFFINKLILGKFLPERLNSHYESMFAIGVDEMSWDDLDSKNYDWPSVNDVRKYRDQVRTTIEDLIQKMPLEAGQIGWDSFWWIIFMGIEHERIHLETSSVLIRELPLSEVKKDELWTVCSDRGPAPSNEIIQIEGGVVCWNKQIDDPYYGWDNEYGEHKADIKPFGASKFLVSNGEFKSFVEEDGYLDQRWWSDEGWQWLGFKKATMPCFWRKNQGHGQYQLRTMLEEIEMPWNWPVEVNFLEAYAFCNWLKNKSGKKIRLPSEDEWRHLYNISEINEVHSWPKSAPGNINLEHFASSAAVDKFQHGKLYDVIGNVWQWADTTISAFSGFKVHPVYDDFSVPTFDDRHYMIKGGSWISTGNEALKDARYAFRAHFFQHAGFRYIEADDLEQKAQQSTYETDELISQYCEFHYGDSYFGVENFPALMARICAEFVDPSKRQKALELGCAVGRSTFELARTFDHVTGLDFSARFIQVADQLKTSREIFYQVKQEGELFTQAHQALDNLEISKELAAKVEFFQADACNLKDLYREYDLILACNLIDRLYDPKKFLLDMKNRLNHGGLMVLASPYTWQVEHTPRQMWLGGYKDNSGVEQTTLDGIKKILAGSFELVQDPIDVPFVIQETKRRYQHNISQVSIWKKIN
ncbi:MAG: 5-histidylcysteine sulfoxide synthase [Bacteriovoracaceae bacterium]|nr:5-histidylcysteine sulfoxide synthase [Bacteriovoracaceae bacterium]